MGDRRITITVLVENTALFRGHRAEHGFAVWLETPDGAILWDTGQSGMLMHNAECLGIDFSAVKIIALSHGHYDHTGGLLDVLAGAPGASVYCHPDVFTERFTPNPGVSEGAHPIGIPYGRDTLEHSCHTLQVNRGPVELLPGISLTGEIPRNTDFEDVGGAFYLDRECTKPDSLIDDQSLVIETDHGLVVLLGCCHAGIVNTLTMVSEHWQTRTFSLIAGGTHLAAAAEDRIEKTIHSLENFDIGTLAPGHCTGWKQVCMLSRAFPEIVAPLHVGWSWRSTG